MKSTVFLIALIFILWHCTQRQHPNRVIVHSQSNKPIGSHKSDTVIFEGTANTFVLNSYNNTISGTDTVQKVIKIVGNSNTIILNQNNNEIIANNVKDTLVFREENKQSVYHSENNISKNTANAIETSSIEAEKALIEYETRIQELHWISTNCDTLQMLHNKVINTLKSSCEKHPSGIGLYELARYYDPATYNGQIQHCIIHYQKDIKIAIDYYKKAAKAGSEEAETYLVIHKITFK